MGSSSSKKQEPQPQPQPQPQITINIDLGGLKEIINSLNKGSTQIESSNSFSLLDGDAPPNPSFQEQNSYNNQGYNIKIQAKNENMNIPINKFSNNNSIKFTPNQNKDNNIKDLPHNKKNENYSVYGNNINPNIKIDENLYQKKETSKGSKYKEEINPNMVKYNGRKEDQFVKPSNHDNNIGNNFYPDNHKFFTSTGNDTIEKEKENFNCPEDNKDNNKIHESMRHPLDNSNINEEKDNNYFTQSVLTASFQNLNFTDPNDLLKIKKIATQKYEEGLYSLFVKMDHKISFYYIRQESTLKSLLFAHLNTINIPYYENKYSMYKKGTKLDQNIPINEMDIPILSVIEIKEE